MLAFGTLRQPKNSEDPATRRAASLCNWKYRKYYVIICDYHIIVSVCQSNKHPVLLCRSQGYLVVGLDGIWTGLVQHVQP